MSPRRKFDKKDKKNKRGKKEVIRRFFKKKKCKFCVEKVKLIDYKNVDRLRSFLTERGKILPRRISGNCAKHQRQITKGIKRLRNLGLLPFIL